MFYLWATTNGGFMLHTYFGISMVNLKYTHKFLICSTIKIFTSIFFICTLKFTKPPKTKVFSFKKLNICVHTPTNTGTKRQKDGHKQMYKITFLIFTNRYNVVKILYHTIHGCCHVGPKNKCKKLLSSCHQNRSDYKI